MRQRLDKEMMQRKLVISRSQAEQIIQRGHVKVNGKIVNKTSYAVSEHDKVEITKDLEQYVSRAGLKLASVADRLKVNFKGKVVLDVGSSTGGFTDYSLKKGATKVYAVDVGTDQLHPSLHNDTRIELHEKTDIRDFKKPSQKIDIVVMDVSFISLREILPHVATLVDKNALIIAMAKPQFEAGSNKKHKGVIKNSKMRRDILSDLEAWMKQRFFIEDKADSDVAGTKGNVERFYRLRVL